jgi:hypothetical protein
MIAPLGAAGNQSVEELVLFFGKFVPALLT